MELVLYAVAVAAETAEPDSETNVHVLPIWAKSPEVAQALAEVQMKHQYVYAQQKWYFTYAVSAPLAYQSMTVAVPLPLVQG